MPSLLSDPLVEMAIHEIKRLAMNATLAGVTQLVNLMNRDEEADNILDQSLVSKDCLFQ